MAAERQHPQFPEQRGRNRTTFPRQMRRQRFLVKGAWEVKTNCQGLWSMPEESYRKWERERAAAPCNRAKRLSKPSVCRDLEQCRSIARVSACMPGAKRLRRLDYSDCTGTQSQRKPILREPTVWENQGGSIGDGWDYWNSWRQSAWDQLYCLSEMDYASLTLAKHSSHYRDCSYLAAHLSLIIHILKETVHHLQMSLTESQLLLTNQAPCTFVNFQGTPYWAPWIHPLKGCKLRVHLRWLLLC